MKKILFSLLCISTIQFSKAQSTIWLENFNDRNISNWTMFDEDGDELNWGLAWFEEGGDPKFPTPMLRSQSWLWYPLSPNNYAVSPIINLKNITKGKLTLKWKVAATDPSRDQLEQYTVYVSTSPELEDIKSSTVFFNETTLEGVNTLTERQLDISEFIGQENIYVTFRHHHTSGYEAWLTVIDDISVVSSENLGTIENSNSKSINITPNPVTNEFSFNQKSTQKISKVEVYDLNGKLIKAFNNQQKNYSIASLPKGVYIVKSVVDNIEYSQKIIKK